LSKIWCSLFASTIGGCSASGGFGAGGRTTSFCSAYYRQASGLRRIEIGIQQSERRGVKLLRLHLRLRCNAIFDEFVRHEQPQGLLFSARRQAGMGQIKMGERFPSVQRSQERRSLASHATQATSRQLLAHHAENFTRLVPALGGRTGQDGGRPTPLISIRKRSRVRTPPRLRGRQDLGRSSRPPISCRRGDS
jgi:hypothetical protein